MDWLESLNEREKCYTARTGRPPLPPVKSGDVEDAWRCPVCGLFVYSTDGNGRPIPGAPSPWRLYDEVTGVILQICSICKAMKDNKGFDTDHWKKLHDAYVEREKKRRDDIDRQTGKKDYFTGA